MKDEFLQEIFKKYINLCYRWRRQRVVSQCLPVSPELLQGLIQRRLPGYLTFLGQLPDQLCNLHVQCAAPLQSRVSRHRFFP